MSRDEEFDEAALQGEVTDEDFDGSHPPKEQKRVSYPHEPCVCEAITRHAAQKCGATLNLIRRKTGE